MGACHRIACGVAALVAAAVLPAHAHSFVLAHDVVPIPGGTLTVSGRIVTEPLSVDLVGHARTWQLGAVTLHDVVATARDHGAGIAACVTGHLGGARVHACTQVPRSLPALRALRGVDARVDVTGTATGQGRARIAWAQGGKALRIERGHVEASLAAREGTALHAGTVRVTADAAGSLGPLSLAVTGEARSADVTVGAVRVVEGVLPIEATLSIGPDGGLLITPNGSLTAKAHEMSLALSSRTLVASEPQLLVHDGRPFTPASLLGDVHVLSSPRIAGLPIDDARDAAFAFRIFDDGVLLEHARVRTLGAELVADRVMFDGGPFDLSIAARGLSLARVLPAVTRGKLGGSGVLDGRIVVRDGDDGLSVRSAVLHARPGGNVQLRGYDWSARALAPALRSSLHKRIIGTLADFRYEGLSLELAPRGSDPEARLVMHGHGQRLAQELELVVNLRGARDAAQHLLQRTGT